MITQNPYSQNGSGLRQMNYYTPCSQIKECISPTITIFGQRMLNDRGLGIYAAFSGKNSMRTAASGGG